MNTSIAIMEIRPGVGGDEAKIWATDLLRMYLKFATSKGWKTNLIDEEVVKISGQDVFNLLKNEAGVHRVQRVPTTEKRGRVHTSTATVAVLPEITENQIYINPNEIEWQFYRASSHGGQNVQKVATAARLLHKPTGIVVSAQSERFQEQNRANALAILRAKLWQNEELKKESTISGYRSVIGHGMRSEKIRTYNFPQNRLTDHRINKSFHNLEKIIDGDLEKVLSTTNSMLS